MTPLQQKICTKTIMVGIVFILGLYLFITQTPYLEAQTSINNVSVFIVPEQPGPYEETALILNSDTIDLSKSAIKWYVDGEMRLNGTGETGVRFTVGPAGSNSQINIEITTSQNKKITKTITIRPSGVDIVWNSFSYTPPFYKGKALAPSSGAITLTAIPQISNSQGKLHAPEDLVYTWSRKGIVLGNSSGIGKQSIVLTHESVPLQPFLVSVAVSLFQGGTAVDKTISIPVTDPIILLYEKHPLDGVSLQSALSKDFTLQNKEITLRAEAYNFSLDDLVNGLLRYRWRIDNKDISTPLRDQNNEITLRREGGVSGLTQVSLKIENDNLPFRVLQSADTVINIHLNGR